MRQRARGDNFSVCYRRKQMDVSDHVGLKNLRRASQIFLIAPCLFYKCLYNMGPNNIREMFLFRTNKYDLRGFCKLDQPTYLADACIGHISTSLHAQDYGIQ